MKVTCGIDWAEKHHDIALVDDNGSLADVLDGLGRTDEAADLRRQLDEVTDGEAGSG